MVRAINRFLLWGLLPLSLSACGSKANIDSQEVVTVQVISSQATLNIAAEVADSTDERQYGLMNRQSVAADAGMLFVWDQDVQNSFWMKDTYVSLDILFIDSNKTIVDITTETTPLSMTPITSASLYRYVLEVRAGVVQQYGIDTGDRLNFTL